MCICYGCHAASYLWAMLKKYYFGKNPFILRNSAEKFCQNRNMIWASSMLTIVYLREHTWYFLEILSKQSVYMEMYVCTMG